jgi:hypothetical protein
MRPRGNIGEVKRRVRRRLIGVLIVATAILIAGPAAAEALTLSNLSAAPDSDQAGAHSDFTIHMDFGGGQVKDLTVGLPPGLIGDPNATPKCTVDELNHTMCDSHTIVGHVDATAQVSVLGIPLPVPITASGSLFNLTPNPGEPARFGIVLNPLGIPGLQPIILQSGVQLRPDYGLDTVINEIPRTTLMNGDTTILSQTITLFGTAPGTGRPFVRNPTSCPSPPAPPHTTHFSAVPYSGTTATGTATFTTSGCGNLDFSPTFTALVGGANAAMKTDVTTSIDQDADEAGLVKAEVAIPPDLNPDVALLGNRCSPADFAASNCPPNSVMGSAIATSPLLTAPLAGKVVFVETGATPDIGLDLQGQLHLLLRGTLGLDKVVVFDGLPDIPIAHFALTFPSSPGLLIASRNLCVPPPPLFHADFTGYNGATTSADSPATVQGACAPTGASKAKCKKAKKKKHRRAAEAKKKHKKKSCKKKKRKKRR